MLEGFRVRDDDLVVCCTPPTPRALPAEHVAAAARDLGVDEVLVRPDVERACDLALSRATADDAVLVSGSLYVAGAARPHLLHRLPG
jgi:dihydrofolate synthase/folylpolyglutamate synthase